MWVWATFTSRLHFSEVLAGRGEERVCRRLQAGSLITWFPYSPGPTLSPKAWDCLFSLQMFLCCSKMKATVLAAITLFILAGGGVSGELARTGCFISQHCPHTSSGGTSRTVLVLNRSLLALLACSHKWNQGYKYTLPGCRKMNCFQDSFLSVFLRIPRGCSHVSRNQFWSFMNPLLTKPGPHKSLELEVSIRWSLWS